MKGSGSQTESYASRRSPRIPSEKLCCYVAWCQYNLQSTLYTARKHCFPSYNFDVDVRSSFPRCFIWSYSQQSFSPGNPFTGRKIQVFNQTFCQKLWERSMIQEGYKSRKLQQHQWRLHVFIPTLWHLYVVFTLIKKIPQKIDYGVSTWTDQPFLWPLKQPVRKFHSFSADRSADSACC